MLVNHLGVQVAGASGDDLLGWESPFGQALGVVLRLQIAGQQGHAFRLIHALQRVLQQRRFAATRRADDVHHKNLVLAEALAQLCRQLLILVQHLLFHYNLAHSSTSTNAICNSSPAMVMVAASPHLGQAVAQFSA